MLTSVLRCSIMIAMIQQASKSTDVEQRSAEWANQLQLKHFSNEDLSKLRAKLQREAAWLLQSIMCPPVFGAADEEEYKKELELMNFRLAHLETEMRGRGLQPNNEASQIIVGR